jgi:hypothetical protein
MSTTNRHYFDADKLILKIYNKIAVWHNNEERLNDSELGRELRFLSEEIAEDVLKAVHGHNTQIALDKSKLNMTEEEVKKDRIEREDRRTSILSRLNEEAKKAGDNKEV